MKATLTFLLFIFTSGVTLAQDTIPSYKRENIKVETKVEKHLWVDSNIYQFIEISIIGLPEIDPFLNDRYIRDSNSIRLFDELSGGYDPPIVISRKETFIPVKRLKEVIYDSISKSRIVTLKSLYLIDDFKHLKSKDSLLLISQGIFGYPLQSGYYSDNYISNINLNKIILNVDKCCPIANSNWYKDWLRNAPKDYWDPRLKNHYDKNHQNFEYYFKEIKIENDK
jgi:hypothetical protein